MTCTTSTFYAFGRIALEWIWSRLDNNYRYFGNGLRKLPYSLRGCISHYYSFGSTLPTRSWSDVSRAYRYGFNGKEKDSETANDDYDFGARIYDARLGRWLSLDPFQHLFRSLSPYSGYGNCPVLVIDEGGNILRIRNGKVTLEYRDGKLYTQDESGQFTIEYTPIGGYFMKALDNILLLTNGKIGLELVNSLMINEEVIEIRELNEDHDTEEFDEEEKIIYTNFSSTDRIPTQKDNEEAKNERTPGFIILAHEMAHARSFLGGFKNYEIWFELDGHNYRKDEIYASHIENKIRAENNLKLRSHYAKSVESTRLIDGNGESIFYSTIVYKFHVKTISATDPSTNVEVKANFAVYEDVAVPYNYYKDGNEKEISTTP